MGWHVGVLSPDVDAEVDLRSLDASCSSESGRILHLGVGPFVIGEQRICSISKPKILCRQAILVSQIVTRIQSIVPNDLTLIT